MLNILTSLMEYLRTIWVILEFDLRKLYHEPSELLLRAIQPALWLLIFGQVLEHSKMTLGISIPYIDFLAPGVLAQGVLFVAIFNGIAVIWERDLGLIPKLVVAPISRSAIVIGKGLGSGVRAISQLIIVYVLSSLIEVKINWSILAFIQVAVFIVLGALLFSTFSLVVACIVKTRERFMGIGQILTMPLFFASNAIYPVSAMPLWLQKIAKLNPLTYEVDAIRALMLKTGSSIYGLSFDFLYLAIISFILIGIGTFLYPRAAR